jgi:condensin complex subunit 1
MEELMSSQGPFKVVGTWDVEGVSEEGMEGHISGQMDVCASCGPDTGLVLEQSNVTDWWCIITGFDHLSAENKCLAADTLIELAAKSLDVVSDKVETAGKNSVKILMYYLTVLVNKFEALERGKCQTDMTGRKRSKKSRAAEDELNWSDFRPSFLDLFLRVLSMDQSLLWTMGAVQENFMNALWGIPLALLEERPLGVGGTGNQEQSVRGQCLDVIALCTARMGSNGCTALTTAVVDALSRSEHMDKYVADMCRRAHSNLSAEIICEVGKMNMVEMAKSGNGVKNIGAFLVAYAEHNPEDMAVRLPMIMHQLDSDVWNIRSCILSAMGHVIAFIHTTCETKLPGSGDDVDITYKAGSGASGATKDALEGEGVAVADGEGDNAGKVSEGDAKGEAESATEEGETGNKDNKDSKDNKAEEGKVEEEPEERNIAKLLTARDHMLNILVERTHDVNAFVRAAVLKVWIYLLEKEAVPVRRMASVGDIAVDRLFDKTAAVRKSAVALMTALLENNPFSGSLNAAPFRTRQDELDGAIKDRIADMRVVMQESAIQSGQATPEDFMDAEGQPLGDDDDDFVASDEVTQDSEVHSLRAEREFTASALAFLATVEAGCPKIEQMISSKTTGDVVESLRFFTRAVNFAVQGSAKSLRATFSLIFHQDEAIRNECLASFRMVFLTNGSDDDAQALPPARVAANIVALCKRCGPAEITSVEKIVGEVFARNHLEPEVVTALWTMAAVAVDDSAREEGAGPAPDLGATLLVLGMISKLQPSILTPSRLQFVVQSGMGSRATREKDYLAMRAAAQCLQNLPAYVPLKGDEADAATKEAMMAAVPFLRNCILAVDFAADEATTRAWFGVCEECMHALFHVLPAPDLVLPTLVTPLYEKVSAAKEGGCSPLLLAKLLFLLGQACVCTLVFTERIATLAKRTSAKPAAKGGDEEAKDGVDAMEEEMGMVAAADAEHERLFHSVTERELALDNTQLLGKFHHLVAFIVANQKGQYGHPVLRETAVMALCRFMCVSSELCEMYLPLLFTVVERETGDNVRTSVVIALGDLAFRFPNSLEPWTAKFYARLADKNVTVRYNTLMTLTHLILNDMIKVKGQVSHIVTCLNDPSDKVRSLARLFFNELAKRSNNPVYNLLGDIIAILSRAEDTPDTAPVGVAAAGGSSGHAAAEARVLSTHEFQSTMTFLLGFVKKDKQGDALVERLLNRLGLADNTTQRRNLAFCIAQLPITEKGVKKMAELIRIYKDCLHDDEVTHKTLQLHSHLHDHSLYHSKSH